MTDEKPKTVFSGKIQIVMTRKLKSELDEFVENYMTKGFGIFPKIRAENIEIIPDAGYTIPDSVDALAHSLQGLEIAPPDNMFPDTKENRWKEAYRKYIYSFDKKPSYKTRICFHCEEAILFSGFWSANKRKPLRWLKKIWKSKYVELYCCTCYRIEKNKCQTID